MKEMPEPLHESYMRLGLKLAGIARERGEVPVGSVIVREGAVIAEGIEGVRAPNPVSCAPMPFDLQNRTVVFGAPVYTVGGFSSEFPVLSTSAIPNWGPHPKIVQSVLREECEAARSIPQRRPEP